MNSVLQGGRRRRSRGARVARLLIVLAPLAVAVAAALGLHVGGHSNAAAPKPTLQQPPGAAPSTSTSAPDPAQAALAGVDAFHVDFHQPPRSGIVFDLETGEVLWRRQPLKVVPIASLTKIMTAVLAVQHTKPRDMVRISKDALDYQGSGVGLLPKGRHVTADSLLYGLLLPSGNDAAIARWSRSCCTRPTRSCRSGNCSPKRSGRGSSRKAALLVGAPADAARVTRLHGRAGRVGEFSAGVDDVLRRGPRVDGDAIAV